MTDESDAPHLLLPFVRRIRDGAGLQIHVVTVALVMDGDQPLDALLHRFQQVIVGANLVRE